MSFLYFLIIPGILGLIFVAVIVFWMLRPHQTPITSDLSMDINEVVPDSWHNGFTDIIYWKDRFFLVYVSSPSHFANERSSLVILSSSDAIKWDEIARLHSPGKDIRDPKLAVIRDTLFLYALLNVSFDPQPFGTTVARSSNGIQWSPFEEISPKGWLFGHPKSLDGEIWYVPAHWREYDKVALFQSEDGEHWNLCSTIIEKAGVDESAVEFLPDGRLLAVIRYEAGGGLFGSDLASTLIVTSISPISPYDRWALPFVSKITRLDSPNLYSVNGRIFGVGRYQPVIKGPFQNLGSVLSRKRTALFLVAPEQLIHLTDFPSAGDTAYAGVVMHAGKIFVSYYTSPIEKDYPWILGMFRPTSVYLASMNLADIDDLLIN